METIKKNLSLIIGILIPFVLVAVVALLVYVPNFMTGVPPKHDFIYALGDNVEHASMSVYGQQYATKPIMSLGTYPDQNGNLAKYRYQIVNGRMEKIENPPPAKEYAAYPQVDIVPKFYVYRVAERKSEEISYEQVKKLKLESSVVSPDGFRIESGRGSGVGFIFGDNGDYQKKYIRKDNYAKELYLQVPPEYYYQDILVGWVVE